MITQNDIDKFLQSVDCARFVIRQADLLKNRNTRLSTVMKYPDGSQIDLFVGSEDWVSGAPTLLTDFSNTLNWLSDAGVDLTSSRVNHYAEIYGIRLRGREFTCAVDDCGLVPAIIRLGQACAALAGAQVRMSTVFKDLLPVRISDAPFTLSGLKASVEPSAEIADARAFIHEQFRSRNFSYDSEAPISGIGRPIKVDFVVRGERDNCAVMVIRQSPRPKIAERWADHAFATFYDLKKVDWKGFRISAFDDISDRGNMNISDWPVRRLEEVSIVINASSIVHNISRLVM